MGIDGALESALDLSPWPGEGPNASRRALYQAGEKWTVRLGSEKCAPRKEKLPDPAKIKALPAMFE
jgi:hypothetical protein